MKNMWGIAPAATIRIPLNFSTMSIRPALLLLLTTISFSVCAQTFSIRTGLNLATQSWKAGNTSYKPKWLAGPHINVAITNSLRDKLASQLEVGYTVIGHGGLFQQVGPVQTSIPEDREGFAMAALIFKYHPNQNFNIHLGPQLGWFVGNRDNLGETDFSVACGVEGYLSKYFGIGGRYCHGISDLNPDKNASQKSRFFQLSLIFRFPSAQLDEMHY
jgi:hypothetical protein